MTFDPHPLPSAIQELCKSLEAHPRLIVHLRLVHDAAAEIIDGLRQRFPLLTIDEDSVLFGAASHDFGKVLHPEELSALGHQHELAGEQLLIENGVSPNLARFCRTHGSWNRESLPLEDLLVALADTVWKGQRLEELEQQVINKIVERVGMESWFVFQELDELLTEFASCGAQRLAWQAQF